MEKPFALNYHYLLPLYFIVFCAFFDTHAQMPILAPYTISLGATPFMLGVVVGTYSLFNLFGNYASGIIIDKKGWLLPLFAGLIGVSLALLLYPQAFKTQHLVFIRSWHGLMGGFLVPASLACLTKNENNTSYQDRLLAVFGATIGLAAVTGPVYAGVIANRFDFHAVYYSLAAIMMAAAIFSLRPARYQQYCIVKKNYLRIRTSWILSKPRIRGSFIFAFGTMGSTGTLASFLPSRSASLGMDHAQTGLLFATFALTAIVVQVGWPKIIKKVIKKNLTACSAGLFLIAAALVLAALSAFTAGLYISLFLYGAGFGLSFQGMLGLVMENSQPAWRGRAIGLFFAVYSLGVAVFPPLSGLAWQHFPALFPFYTSAAAALISLLAGKKACCK